MCRVDWADDDGTWLREPYERTARKQHCCGDCGRQIEPGERYTAGTWVSGYVTSLRICAHCIEAGRWLNRVCGGHLYPGVIEELREHWDEEWDYRSLGLGRIVVCSESRWKRNGELVPLARVAAWVDDALRHVPSVAGTGSAP